MLKQIIRMSVFKKDFEHWREFQYQTDPYLKYAIDFLDKKLEDVSEEAVLASMVRIGKLEIRKDE